MCVSEVAYCDAIVRKRLYPSSSMISIVCCPLRSEVNHIQHLICGASRLCSLDERRRFPIELSHTRGIARAPSNRLVQIMRQRLLLFSFLPAFGALITVGSISSKEGKQMNRTSRDARRSLRSVIGRTLGTWLLMAAGASLVLSALFPARVAAAPWSVAQSLNQLLMVYGQFSNLAASAPYATQGVGGFVFFNTPQECSGSVIQAGIAALNADATRAGQVVPWMSTDEEGGTVQRLACVIGVGGLPSARQMAAQWTTSQVQANLAAHGAAMRSLGITMDLAPVMDTSPANWPYNDESDRSFSNDPNTVTAYGLAFANGLGSSGIVALAKHFPGLGHAVGNTDQEPATDPPFSTLQGDDLIPFAKAISAGIPVVMVGHPSVPGLTGTVPATLSPATYQYLRNTLHFNGVAMTDSLAAGAIAQFGYSQPAAAVAAIEAGADMAMIDSTQWQATLSALESAVNSGALPMARVNASVLRILKAKGLIGRISTGWTSLGGGLIGGPALASMSAAHLDLYVRGTDNALWTRWWNGSAWSNWQSLGGQLTSDPSVVASGPNQLAVFVRGTDNGLWYRAWNGTVWSGWQSLGGGFKAASAPEAASWGPNRIDVFVQGTDMHLWHIWTTGSGWSGWENRGGILTSAPGAVSWGPNRIDVFVRGPDNAMWHTWWNGSAWSGWESQGGILTSSPEAASWGPNQLDVYALGAGNVMYQQIWNGSSWTSRRQVDSSVWTADPGAVGRLPQTIDLVERGTDGAAWLREISG